MRGSVLCLMVAVIAAFTTVVDSHCGVGGCACSDEPLGTCCPGFTCGRRGRCVETVTLRDEFVYPYPYDFYNYGYTESGVPGYEARYSPQYAYAGGSPAFGNNYVGYEFGRAPYTEFLYAGI